MSTEPALDRSVAHFENQLRDVRSLAQEVRDELIISLVRVDGSWSVLSLYGADRWELVPETTNKAKSSGILDFTRVPEPFREGMRAMMYRYLHRGRSRQRRPSTASMKNLMTAAILFLRFLSQRGIQRFRDVSPMVCKLYVDVTKDECRGRRNKPLTAGTLLSRFTAVEAIHELSQFTDDPMPSAPWVDTSAKVMVGLTGPGDPRHVRGGTTPLMPNDVFTGLFQAAWKTVEQGECWLDLRDGLAQVEASRRGQPRPTVKGAKNRYLATNGWSGGLVELHTSLLDLRTACYIVIASVSGCRNHELAFIQTDACYSSEDANGEIYWWLKSRSTKTGAGRTEWMIPEAAVTALKVMDRWAQPYQAMIADEIVLRRAANPADPEIAEAQKHQKAVFLGKTQRMDNKIRTLSVTSWNVALRNFSRRHGIDWTLGSHQFRRKFANYAARSQFGDLRYLKDHFKHWSMDMTLGYALNESQELALFAEIDEELDGLKEGVVEQWLRPAEPLAGGYGHRIMAWRGSSEITIFKDRSSMVRSIADSTAIRSNGHAWCTADDDLCVGNGSLEATRCTGCENAVIDRAHAHVYQGLYEHLKEVLDCQDIGEGGLARVRRDAKRCRDVLSSLGHDVEGGSA